MLYNKVIREILFILFALYFLQGIIYPSGSFISQSCLFFILFISIFYFFKTLLIENKSCMFFNFWTLLMFWNIFGFIFTSDFTDFERVQMFKNILGCMLPFYPFYYFTKRNEINSNCLIRFFLVMLPIVIIQFYNTENVVALEEVSAVSEIVNNVSYLFVGLLPFVFLIKKWRIISGILMILIVLFIIQGAKRGAILAGLIGLLVFFYFQIRVVEGRKKIYGYLYAILFIGILSFLTYKIFIKNEFVVGRMASLFEGNLSNRDIIYKTIFNEWYYSGDIQNTIFGFGFAASLKMGGNLAHNDWLELLSNFGLVGVIIYLILFAVTIRNCFSDEYEMDLRITLIAITLIWFFISAISMWYSSLSYFTHSILLAYIFGSKGYSTEYQYI